MKPYLPNTPLVGMTILLAGGIFVLDIFQPLGVAVGILYTSLVLITLWFANRLFTLSVATASSLLVVLGFSVKAPHPFPAILIENRVLTLIMIWVAAIFIFLHKRALEERERLFQELQDALGKIKTLRGLLPICSSCKKIRDDQGYWNQIELYIHEHTDAQFSHGLCPECFKKLYPDFVMGDK
ncbi:MAG TPA: hypothetical protein VE222_06925 [Nitrospiraceae bacterium]|nr:hypothetical protein [Nitrospiraceae bacterium]